MRVRGISIGLAAIVLAGTAARAFAATVAGGGSSLSDCAVTLEIPGANVPAPPKVAKGVDCTDGDPTCDSDGLRNGECVFELQLCANSTAITGCTPDHVDSITVEHAIDDGSDPRFDTDFQALQLRATGLGLPSFSDDDCTLDSAITVKLRGPDSTGRMKSNRKILALSASGGISSGSVSDRDKVKFNCRPEGDGVYEVTDLYTGTFDRIRKQVFAQSCALSGCHDSENHTGNLILLPGAAYSNLVDVTPDNVSAATDLLKRVTPGNEAKSLLYVKVSGSPPGGYGSRMPLGSTPLEPAQIELIRKWIVGDGVLGPAPETGWVTGTDQ